MAALSDFQGYLTDWLQASSARLSIPMQTLLVNMAIHKLARKYDWRYFESSAAVVPSGSLTAISSIGPPLTLLRPQTVWYVDLNGNPVTLQERDREFYVETYGNTLNPAPSIPTDYALFGSNIFWGPQADGTTTINVDGYYMPADLSAGTDHNPLTDQAYEVVLWTALWLSGTYMIEDQRTDVWKGLMDEQIFQIEYEHQKARMAGIQAPVMNEPGA